MRVLKETPPTECPGVYRRACTSPSLQFESELKSPHLAPIFAPCWLMRSVHQKTTRYVLRWCCSSPLAAKRSCPRAAPRGQEADE